ncbi:MAG: hydrogenase accessory protein HupE [Gammaproteobacteria bacterium]|nr:hydrogenase accessory protein HupE [Gammaproteobacteria bacterium]
MVNYSDDNEAGVEVTENVRALLTEISSMLSALINDDVIDSIDIHSLPLLPGEHEAIQTILGQGEVKANFDSLGTTTIYETALAGVWWVTHNNEEGDCIAETIDITTIPAILESQHDDIENACTALQEQLKEWNENS